MIPPKDEWVTVERAPLEVVAEMMRARLEAEGIEAILRGNIVSSTAGAVNELNISWDNPLGGVEVRVHQDDEAQAREILEQSRAEVPSRRTTPPTFQIGVALWFIFPIAFSVGMASNAFFGILTAAIFVGALLALGNRRL